MTTKTSSPVTELQAVKDAIWQAHKDNFHLRMLDIYPMMAVAALEAMRANAQCVPGLSWRDEDYNSARNSMIEVLRLRSWSITDRDLKAFDEAFQHAVGILALSAVTSTDSGGNNV